MEPIESIDTFKEEIIPLDFAAKHVSKISGKKRNRPMMTRWANKGVSGVRLRTIAIGREIFTSKEALNEFLNKTREAKRKKRSNETAVGIHRARVADIEAAAAELGI